MLFDVIAANELVYIDSCFIISQALLCQSVCACIFLNCSLYQHLCNVLSVAVIFVCNLQITFILSVKNSHIWGEV